MSSTMPGSFIDPDWGCEHQDLASLSNGNVRACRVSVRDIGKLASALANVVLDTSWMSSIDAGARRSYERTVEQTSALLAQIFVSAAANTEIGSEFGEIMVSMGSVRALSQIFDHSEVPLAELWKPQRKQNEGFDFHTVCPSLRINFGEAKYSSSGNPHGIALQQIDGFVTDQKHLRDRVHLINLVPKAALDNLDVDDFGVVAAFSLNAQNRDLVIRNAIQSAQVLASKHRIAQVFVVGVSHDT